MNYESYECVNSDRSFRAIIENDHWQSAEDPIGFTAYTLFIIDFETGVMARDHLYDTFEICLEIAERDYGFDPKAWKKRTERVQWPERGPSITAYEKEQLEKKLAQKVAMFRSRASS